MRSFAIAALSLLGCGPVPRPAAPATGPAAVRAQHLVDLFDAARLSGDASARAELWASLGRPAGAERGEAATRFALEKLAEEAERAGAAGLGQLLDDDLAELDGGDARAIAERRRRLGREDGLAAGHALLALYASCARPLADAAGTVPWKRAAIADRCLYPLYEADPEPYFRADASLRPPDPPWSRFLDGLARLLAEARARAPRLAPVIDRIDGERRKLAEAIDLEGLAPPDVERLAPRLPAGDPSLPPYDRTPWVIVDDDMAVVGRARFTTRDHLLVERIDRVLTVQRLTGARGRVALFVPAGGSADAVDSLGELAKRGGAEAVELVLTAPLVLRAPAGDVWAGRPPDRRFVVLPLQLRASSGRDLPREVGEHAASVTLLVAPDGVTAMARDGTLALGPTATLRERLAELKRAFPDEVQVALAIDPTASYAEVVAAARAARATFREVALLPVPRPSHEDAFAARVRRRAAARVVARSPDERLAARVAVLRGCYLDALDRDPATAGAVRIAPGAPPTVEEAPGDAQLRECLQRRAGAIAPSQPVTVELAPR